MYESSLKEEYHSPKVVDASARLASHAMPICYHKLIKDLYGWRCVYCSKRFEQNIIRREDG